MGKTRQTPSICDHGVPPRDLGTIAREDPRRTYQEDGELWSNGAMETGGPRTPRRRPDDPGKHSFRQFG